MKLLFTAIIAWCAWLPMSQASAQQKQPVQEVAGDHGNAQTISLCASNGALDMTNATSSGTINGSFSIEIYNLAASTVTINCGFDASVSSTSTSGYYGREVAPGIGVTYQVRLPTVKPFCMTQNSSGCTRVTVTQLGK